MKLRDAVFVALLAITVVTRVRADGLVRDGVGPISGGRGGTNVAFADNAAIILDNPAGMMNVAGTGLAEIGVDTCISIVDYSDPYDSVRSHVRPLPMPNLGIIRKIDDRWAWGFGAFVPAGFGANYGAYTQPPFGTNQMSALGGMGKLLPALSFRATERLSLGISVGIGVSYASFEGPLYMPEGNLAGAPAILDMEGTGFAPVGSVGMQYRLTENTMIGACYTEQSNFWLHGGTNATILLPGPFALSSHYDSKMKLKWPRSVSFGIKHDLCPHRRASADVIWYDWAHAFDGLEMFMYTPTNPAVGPILSGAGESLPVRQVLPMNWRNSVSMRLGYEEEFTDRDTLRFGYVYHSSPAPDSTLNPYLDGILQHTFSLGYTRKLQRGAKFNVAYQYYFGDRRHVGTSALPGGQFNNSTIDAQAHLAMLSLLMPF